MSAAFGPPQLLSGNELACLLRSELTARCQQMEALHRELMQPFPLEGSPELDPALPGDPIAALQLLIQAADRHIDTVTRLLADQARQLQGLAVSPLPRTIGANGTPPPGRPSVAAADRGAPAAAGFGLSGL
ncbi:MAG TPA: hypothetical protein VMV93_07635 [Chloroflexota bacterium]|nr:hypothetical protein [Chloroflexota bacterium]